MEYVPIFFPPYPSVLDISAATVHSGLFLEFPSCGVGLSQAVVVIRKQDVVVRRIS